MREEKEKKSKTKIIDRRKNAGCNVFRFSLRFWLFPKFRLVSFPFHRLIHFCLVVCCCFVSGQFPAILDDDDVAAGVVGGYKAKKSEKILVRF